MTLRSATADIATRRGCSVVDPATASPIGSGGLPPLATRWGRPKAVLLVYGGYCMVFVSQQWTDRAFVAVAAVTMSALQFVYFYKRRAMFGARWRWGRLERWCPRLVGPETVDPVRVPGFAGLSHARRLLLVLVVLAGIAFERLSWGTPRPRPPVDQDDEEGRLVTFYVG